MKKPFEKFIKWITHLFVYLNCFLVFTCCNFSSHKTKKLELNPVLNKLYNYSFAKTSVIKWPYNGTAYTKYDTILLNFSMQKFNNSDSVTTFKVTCNHFKWRSDVNYIRDSLHLKPITISMNDSGTVMQVLHADELLQDIEKDSATQNNLTGVLPDYISENGIKDLFNKIFALLPVKKVNENDTWVRNKIRLAKAPISVSNLYVLKSFAHDSAMINIQSYVSARQSVGNVTYLKGDENGYVIVNYSTGMPLLFETQSDVVTATNYYDIKSNEHIVVKLNN